MSKFIVLTSASGFGSFRIQVDLIEAMYENRDYTTDIIMVNGRRYTCLENSAKIERLIQEAEGDA